MFISLPVGCSFVVVVQSNSVVVFVVYCIAVVEAFRNCIFWRNGLPSCKFCMLRFFARQMFSFPGRNLLPHLRQSYICLDCGVGRMGTLSFYVLYFLKPWVGYVCVGVSFDLFLLACLSSFTCQCVL